MIACLYGKTAELFVGPTVDDLQEAAAACGADVTALTIEGVLHSVREWQSVERLYTLPFDVPRDLPDSLPRDPSLLLAALFPRAELVNPPAVHELAWDKVATARRLIDRGVPMPESLVTGDPEEARAFVREHGQAVLKETRSCGGQGHVVVFADESGTIGGEAQGSRYAVDFEDDGVARSLAHGVLTCPPPFYLQRLVTDVGRHGALKPAQILRAYVVGGQVVFWTERYRDRIRRPSDFIISVAFGARYRFLPEVSDAAKTVARRAAEVLGVRVGAVDLIRTGGEGPYVLEVDTDGHHMMIDRSFKQLPEYRDVHDFDGYIAELLTAPKTTVAPPRSPGSPRAPRRRRGVKM